MICRIRQEIYRYDGGEPRSPFWLSSDGYNFLTNNQLPFRMSEGALRHEVAEFVRENITSNTRDATLREAEKDVSEFVNKYGDLEVRLYWSNDEVLDFKLKLEQTCAYDLTMVEYYKLSMYDDYGRKPHCIIRRSFSNSPASQEFCLSWLDETEGDILATIEEIS